MRQRLEGRRHIRATLGFRDINAGMDNDMCGFRDDGFFHPAPVPSGYQTLGPGKEMNGCFIPDAGVRQPRNDGTLQLSRE